MRTLLLLVLVTGLLTACGKKGPPDPPGPPEKIIWPKSYPTPTPQR
jgi:predicted small lipoprotein YifL